MAYKDKATQREKQKQYALEHAEQIRANKRRYYQEHKDQIKAKVKKWAQDNPERYKAKVKECAARWYQVNKSKCSIRGKKWRQENQDKRRIAKKRRNAARAALINAIKVHYGCLNPGCQWAGEFPPYILDFHHLEAKAFNVSQFAAKYSSIKPIVKEINKCTVLCAICHRMETNGLLSETAFPKCRLDEEGNILPI